MDFSDKIRGVALFLERYKNFTPPSLVLSRSVCAAVKEIAGISLREKDVQVSRGIAHIRLGGAQKSEILLHKEKILSLARTNIGASLRDLR